MQGWKIVKVLIFKVVSFNFEHFFPLNNLLISLLTVQRNLNFPTIASFCGTFKRIKRYFTTMIINFLKYRKHKVETIWFPSSMLACTYCTTWPNPVRLLDLAWHYVLTIHNSWLDSYESKNLPFHYICKAGKLLRC